MNLVFDHFDGEDPSKTHQSLTREPIDRDQIMA